MAATRTAPLRTIEVTLREGRKVRVGNIPANAKITYGPVSPGNGRGYSEGNCLRIYTTTNNQLAVFVNVVEFRDLSLTVERQTVRKLAAEQSENGPKGRKRVASEEIELDWEED